MATEPGDRPESADKTGRTAQVFIRDESGEPANYCGPVEDREATRIAMGHVMSAMVDGAMMADEEDVEFAVEIWWMTPDEVAAIPEI